MNAVEQLFARKEELEEAIQGLRKLYDGDWTEIHCQTLAEAQAELDNLLVKIDEEVERAR